MPYPFMHPPLGIGRSLIDVGQTCAAGSFGRSRPGTDAGSGPGSGPYLFITGPKNLLGTCFGSDSQGLALPYEQF